MVASSDFIQAARAVSAKHAGERDLTPEIVVVCCSTPVSERMDTPKPKSTQRKAASPKSLRPFQLHRRSVMFDNVSQVAEKLATNVSRRAFLGRLGQGAVVLAGAMGAMLAFPGLGQAHGCSGPCCRVCYYNCPDGTLVTKKATNTLCKSTFQGCLFAQCYSS
jgi:hypothetical protein